MGKIVVSGYYGFDNIGDDAMIETFSNYFKRKGIDLIVMSKNPLKTNIKYGVNSINRSNVFEIISSIKSSDAVISGGGTLLQDVTKIISIWYYLSILIIAFLFKKPVYILFQGIGPINNKFNVWLTKKVLKKVKGIYLRDNKALEEMKRLGFDTANVIVTSDLVFALDLPNKNESKELIKKEISGYNEDKKYLGVSLRPWRNSQNEDVFANILDKISNELNLEIVFFPFHKKQDVEFSNRIRANMKSKSYVIQGDYLPSQVAGQMSMMNLNIGVRLHSLIFATITKVPTIGISYDPKVDGFLKELGMKPICNYVNLEQEKIVQAVRDILDGNYDYKVFDIIDKNKKDVIDILNKIIGEIYGEN